MARASRFILRSGHVRLSGLDFGGSGPPCLLVHGLAGAAVEWREAASSLTRRLRVVAFDQRGHGASSRTPGQYTRDAYIADVIAVLEHLGAGAVVIGQSMGGTNAYLATARRPELVRALVVVEAGTSPDPEVPERIRGWLEAWPTPFPSRAAAAAYFASVSVSPAWATTTLVRRADGYRPRFEIDDMVASLAADAETDHAEEWVRIRCPTLVVAGAESGSPEPEGRQMAVAIPHGSYVRVEGAGHDVHLDQPVRFGEVVCAFLDGPTGRTG